MKTLAALILRSVGFCVHFAWWVVAGALLLTLLSGWYAVTHFAMTTDINKLLSSNSPARQREIAFEKAFPQFNTIIAVVDAPTQELVEAATNALVARLTPQKNFFRAIEQPQGGAFIAQNGLLFEPVDQLKPQMSKLVDAQRLLQVLASDQSLRGVIRALQFGLLGVQGGRIKLDDLTWAMTLASNTLHRVEANEPASFSWQALVQGAQPKPADLLRLLIIPTVLDFADLQPGLKASDAIRTAAADLNLASAYQAHVHLTGPVPLDDDEFATIKENAALNATVTIAVVLFILWLALRWFRMILAVTISVIVGLALTAALGLLLVGALNLISVYFAVLFVGLGVDFGIQYCVRYRAERHEVDGLREALVHAGRRAGAPLTLAAVATAAGFFAFLPTDYRGLSELGLIAGFGMLIAFLTSVTLLPALLSLLNPPNEPRPLGYSVLAPVDLFLERHRVPILIGTIVIILGASPMLFWLRFDFNPMHLRNPKSESVATYLQLEKDGVSGANDIQLLQPSLTAADQTAAKLKALPEIGRVVTLSTFIPDHQDAKLPLIQNAEKALHATLYPNAPSAPPTDAENVSMINTTVGALNRLAGDASSAGAVAARRLATDMAALAKADPAVRQRAEAAFVTPLRIALDDLRRFLTAHEVTRDDLPPDLVNQWVTPDGRARVEIAPATTRNDNAALRSFAHAVQTIAPDATEGPISILQARTTIIDAFLEAGACALLSIAVLLWITLRRPGDVLLTLIPLLVAGVVTLEICVLIDLPLNFANIIALPLLLGVGVAFKIYYIMAWREGQTRLLQSVLTRAVTFSACTTATAFGSLYFSSDPGTSSMGKLLAISLLTTMAAAALFQPILMGKPRQEEEPRPVL